jgi:DNA-binding response OmpR family regulator
MSWGMSKRLDRHAARWPNELVARIHAIMRRSAADPGPVLSCGDAWTCSETLNTQV